MARRAEDLGFDGLWVNDHMQSPGREKDEPTFDALTTLTALAGATRRVRLGTAVLSASYRPPAVAAKALTILDVICGGRLVVGLGTGSDVAEHRAYGIPFDPPGERTAAVRRALDDDARDVRRAGDAPPNQPPPATPGGPPIWLAAHGPRLLRAAGAEADGVVVAFAEPSEVARRLAIAEAARVAAGRPPLSCALYTFVLPVPSRAGGGGLARPGGARAGHHARRADALAAHHRHRRAARRGARRAGRPRGRGRHRRRARAAVAGPPGGAGGAGRGDAATPRRPSPRRHRAARARSTTW